MRKVLLTLLSFVALSALVACGGGSSNNNTISIPPVPSGGNSAGFLNSSLTGNFVFAVNGTTQNNNFATTGIFTADGNGNITAGVRDTVNDGGSQVLNESISGNYSINQDGRGQVVLNGASGQVIYRFILQTASAPSPVVGKLFQDGTTSNSVLIDAVGRIEAQAGSPSSVAGAYIVRLDGEDGSNNPYGAVGNLAFSAGGISGTIDENDNGNFDINGSLAATGGYSFSGDGRGTLGYLTPNSSAGTPTPQGNHNFIAYFVTPSHLELISVDPKFFLHGYADLQTSVSASASAFTASAPNQVFTLSGFDASGTRVETGRLTLDSSGDLINAIEDVNNASSFYSGVSLAGSSFAVGANGRWTANLVNTPTAGSTTGLVGWQVSPEQSSILTTNPNVLETGTVRGQTLGLTNANVVGNYAEAFSGTNASVPSNLELTGNLIADGAGNLSGTYDSQADNFGLNLDVGTTGNYTVDPTLGRSTNGNINGIPVVIYTVDKNTIDFISAQQFSVYQGMMVSQTP